MRLRTKMVGATTLALMGLTLAVQRWAAAPLSQPPVQRPEVQARSLPPTPRALVRPSPSPAAGPAPGAEAQARHHPPVPSVGPTTEPVPGVEEARAYAPAAPESGAQAAAEVRAAQTSIPQAPDAPSASGEDEAARREVRALMLAAARELASAPVASPTGGPQTSEPPRDAAELQPVAVEVALPRVELAEPTLQAQPEARIDLATGAGLEATQPPPAQLAAPPAHELPAAAQDASEAALDAQERLAEEEVAAEPGLDSEPREDVPAAAPSPYP